MERVTINVEKREERGKGAARSLRRKEIIPAILYRAGKSLPIKIPKKELTKFINTTFGEQAIVNLQFKDGENKLALIKDFQIDPIKKELLHADFFEVSLTEKVRVNVHISTIGEPIGVKRDSGILQNVLREIEVECLPDKIPGHITVDISSLEIGHSFYVKDLQLGEGIKILTDPDEVIVNILAPAVEEEAVAEAPPEEVAEPELVKKGKKEEEKEPEQEQKQKE